MHHARLTIHPSFVVGPVRRGTFGSFVEHLGRCVYTGIFEPDHPTADDQGFRGDVLELVRELGVSTIRYPGGNFVSGYKWEDGVGPVDERPARLDLAWHSTEPNTFGLNEFMAWTKASGTEPMMAINLGTRGLQEALDLLEYANGAGDTHLAQQRREHGVEGPHAISFWCLGNEMDGKWQLGAKTAREYGRLAAETARGMRQFQPHLTLVACGSSGSDMPTFGTWEREVLDECFDEVDMISAHAYYRIEDGDLGSFLASAQDMDHFISAVSAAADAVAIERKSSKRIHISFDEWNVWYHDLDNPAIPKGDDWPVAPPLEEDVYSVADAVVVGNLLISLLRHTDRVHSASLAQLVNALAPITTEPGGAAWRQTTFHPFALTSRYARGEVLQVAIDSPTYENPRFGSSALVDAVATRDEDGSVTVFAVNRSTDAATSLDLDIAALGAASLIEAVTYSSDDPFWRASKDDSTSVLPQPNTTAQLHDGEPLLTVELPPVSWSMIRLVGGVSS